MPNKFVIPGGEPEPTSYRYQEFPMILYRDGAYKVVKCEEEEAAALDEGWGKNPEHKSPPPVAEVAKAGGVFPRSTGWEANGAPPKNCVVVPPIHRRLGRPRTAKA